MKIRKEEEYALQDALVRQLQQGRIDRREFLTRSMVAGLGLAGIGAATKGGIGSARAQDRPLTPTFYQWIEDLHPSIPKVIQLAPLAGQARVAPVTT